MADDKRSRMMAEESIPKIMTNFAVPAIISMLIAAIYNVVDTIFVGRIGTEAIAATTIAFPIFMAISTFGLAIGIGAASYISRLLGAKEIENVHKTGSTALFTTAALAILLTGSGITFLQPLLIMFGATETILPYALAYTGILVSGAIFTMCNMCMNNMLRAEGSIKMSMIGIASGAILNIILDPIFIFTLGMGVKGAAVATVLAQAISTCLLIGYYLTGKSLLQIHVKHFAPSLKIYAEILKIGTPTLLRQGLISVAMALTNTVAGMYGDAAIAAIGIILKVSMPGFMVVFGFAQGFQPIAGFNYGAKRYDRLIEAVRVSLTRTTVFCGILTVVFLTLTEPIIRMFSNDPQVLDIGVRGLRYFSLVFPTFGFNVTVNVLFAALGQALPAGILSLSRQGLFLIPGILILPHLFGLTGLLISQPVADLATTILTFFLATRTFRELKTLQAGMGDETGVPAYS